jgi:hypothetical protein
MPNFFPSKLHTRQSSLQKVSYEPFLGEASLPKNGGNFVIKSPFDWYLLPLPNWPEKYYQGTPPVQISEQRALK